MVFKYYIHRSREKQVLNIDILTDNLTEIKKEEKRISLASNNTTETYSENWCVIDNVLPKT